MTGGGEGPAPPTIGSGAAADPAIATPGGKGYTDGRALGEWQSRYPVEAIQEMRFEAWFLGAMLIVVLIFAGIFLGMASDDRYSIAISIVEIAVSCKLLAIFFCGCVGGTTFSIKWLMHSVAKGKWHLDRRYWRFFVPAIGGVYACVVTTLFGAGLLAKPIAETGNAMSTAAALAFLVGYFSDGVSGLLSNVANAVFGTLEKK